MTGRLCHFVNIRCFTPADYHHSTLLSQVHPEVFYKHTTLKRKKGSGRMFIFYSEVMCEKFKNLVLLKMKHVQR